jgi:hypothetical protein
MNSPINTAHNACKQSVILLFNQHRECAPQFSYAFALDLL